MRKHLKMEFLGIAQRGHFGAPMKKAKASKSSKPAKSGKKMVKHA